MLEHLFSSNNFNLRNLHPLRSVLRSRLSKCHTTAWHPERRLPRRPTTTTAHNPFVARHCKNRPLPWAGNWNRKFQVSSYFVWHPGCKTHIFKMESRSEHIREGTRLNTRGHQSFLKVSKQRRLNNEKFWFHSYIRVNSELSIQGWSWGTVP